MIKKQVIENKKISLLSPSTPKQEIDMFTVINAINQKHRRFINLAKHIDLLSPKRHSS
jgi:hypothetical protein